MRHQFVYDVPRVAAFVRALTPGMHTTDDMVAIGAESDGALVAGVLYEGINPFNCWMHVAVRPKLNWSAHRTLLRACFAYPFKLCKVRRVSGYVNESNAASRRLCERLGFKPEAVLQGAAVDGKDVIIMAMWREDCRFLEKVHGQQEQ